MKPFLISGLVSLLLCGGMDAQKARTCANVLATTAVQQEVLRPDPAILVLRQFYEAYITEWSHKDTNAERTAAIQQQYITRRLFDRLQEMYQEMELDYDPFLEAQDCDNSVLEKLRIEKDPVQPHVYRVYLWDNYNRKYKTVILLLKHSAQAYKIDNILSLPDKYHTKSSAPVD